MTDHKKKAKELVAKIRAELTKMPADRFVLESMELVKLLEAELGKKND